jgi:hypothetical protein
LLLQFYDLAKESVLQELEVVPFNLVSRQRTMPFQLSQMYKYR